MTEQQKKQLMQALDLAKFCIKCPASTEETKRDALAEIQKAQDTLKGEK